MHRGVPAEHCYSEDYLDDRMRMHTHGQKAGLPASQLAIRKTDLGRMGGYKGPG